MRLLSLSVIILCFAVSQAKASADFAWVDVSRRLVHLAQERPLDALAAVHESAHLVANQNLATGMDVTDLTIGRTGFGSTAFEISESSLARVLGSFSDRLLMRRIAVLHAGYFAERAFLLGVRNDPRLGSFADRVLRSQDRAAQHDRRVIERMLVRSVGTARLSEVRSRAERFARNLILRHQREIELRSVNVLEELMRARRSCSDQIRHLFRRDSSSR